jgi:hypothetical protein
MVEPDIAPRPGLAQAKPSGDHIPLGGFVFQHAKSGRAQVWKSSSVSRSFSEDTREEQATG